MIKILFEHLTPPETVYYGTQTEEGKLNFGTEGSTIAQYPLLIQYLAMLKKASAMANHEIGVMAEPIAKAICLAADDVISGKISMDNFPLPLIQGGGFISFNMNMNEVIAGRANEILTGDKRANMISPNNHVNLGQSTNDVIPTVMLLALYRYADQLISKLRLMKAELQKKVKRFERVVKASRTCLQDAVPITLGQEFSAYVVAVEFHLTELKKFKISCLRLPLGGTVSGTGLGTYKDYVDIVYKKLREITQLSVQKVDNYFAAFQCGEFYAKASAVLRNLALFLLKIGKDFRLLSSSGNTGYNELILPVSLQAGSSAMPGKINPVQPELLMQIAFEVCGHDTTIAMALSHIEQDLNVWESIITKCLLESMVLMENGIFLFVNYCLQDTEANIDQCYRNAESSMAISVVISQIFGYEVGKKVVHYASTHGQTIKEAVIHLGLLDDLLANEVLDPLRLTDINKSKGIIEFLSEKKQQEIKDIISSIELDVRKLILHTIAYVLHADLIDKQNNSTCKNKNLFILHMTKNALMLEIKDEEIAVILEKPELKIEGLERLNQSNRELIYICGYLNLSDTLLNKERVKIIQKLIKNALQISDEREAHLLHRVKVLRKEKIKPQWEALAWWEEFSALIVHFMELTGLDSGTLALQDKIFRKIESKKQSITPSDIAIIKQNILSKNSGIALYSLEMIEKLDHRHYFDSLLKLIMHPVPEVRLKIIERLEKENTDLAISFVQDALRQENEENVKEAMLLFLATFDKNFSPSLDSPAHKKVPIIIGFLRSGEIKKTQIALGQLALYLSSGRREEKLLACYILGESKLPVFSQQLLSLLKEEDESVQNAALLSIGKLNEPKLYITLVHYLTHPATQHSAAEAIVLIGEAIFPCIETFFREDEDKLTNSVMKCLLRICRRNTHGQAIQFLVNHLNFQDVTLRTEIVILLNHVNYSTRDDNRMMISNEIDKELFTILTILAMYLACEKKDDFVLLKKSMQRSLSLSKIRLLSCLSFIYSRDTIEDFWNSLQQSSNDKIQILRSIHKILPPKLAEALLILVRNISLSDCFRQLKVIFPEAKAMGIQEALLVILNDHYWYSYWMKACLIYEVVGTDYCSPSILNCIRAHCRSTNSLLKETACWAINQLEGKKINSMMLAIEKLIFLKGTEMFAQIPEEVIYSIVEFMETRSFAAGEQLIKKGDTGNYMFFIVKGSVSVLLPDQKKGILLGAYESVGELSLIDDIPRSADVIAKEDTLILILNRKTFNEAIANYPEVSIGLLRVLSRRIRDNGL